MSPTPAPPAAERPAFRTSPPLPAPRALLGVALVAASVVGTFVAAGGGTPPAAPTRVVATTALDVGHVILADDLALAPVSLGDVDAAAFADPSHLHGAVVLGPIGEGELIQSASVHLLDRPDQPPPPRQLSVTLGFDDALAGGVRPGERVDVIGTTGSGATAQTEVLARDVAVLRTQVDERPAPGAAVVVTLAPATEHEAIAVAHAAEAGTLRLMRSGRHGS